MTVTVLPGGISGTVEIIPSKSQLHRLLICAALADEETVLCCQDTEAEDVLATIRCLEALGAGIQKEPAGLRVKPLQRGCLPSHCVLPCKESGSTLRFLLPVVSALGVSCDFHMEGRLPQRPLAPLDALLTQHGISLTRPQPHILRCEGQLLGGEFTLPGNISSQYISGLLFALPLLKENSSLTVLEPIESKDYIDMTQEALESFTVLPIVRGSSYHVEGGVSFQSPGTVLVEGDWSNAAFWLCAGAVPGGKVCCQNLNPQSPQGDRAIGRILEEMGAQLRWQQGSLSVEEGRRQAVTINAASIPDLIPALAAVAAVSDGVTVIEQAGRLRLKESDRLAAIAQTLNALGAKVTEEEEGLRIEGVPRLIGGSVDAWGDHRIAMMAAIASAACESPVTIRGAEAVNKSYPSFWRVLASLGKTVREEGEA